MRKLIYFLFLAAAMGVGSTTAFATVTASFNGGTAVPVSADTASSGFQALGNITITEAQGDLAANTNLVINAPTGYTFNTSGVTASKIGGVGIGTPVVTSSSITLPITALSNG